MHQCKQFNEQLSGYIDLELNQQTMQHLSHHLESCTDCQNTYTELVSLKNKTGELQLPRMEEEELMQIMHDRTAKTLQNIGWTALSLGLIGLLFIHWVTLWQNPAESLLVKVLLTLIEAGGLLLFFSVLRQRLIARKTDRYNDIQL